MTRLLSRSTLRYGSYAHSLVYFTLLWASLTDRAGAVSVLGCAAAVPTSGSVAISAAGRDVWLLTGDDVSISADGGTTW